MDGYGKRILVVHEDAGRRALLKVQLEQEGYAVQTACDAVTGADEMRKRHFEAIIVDGRMPEFSGHKFAAVCKLAWPSTPVIFLSGDLIQFMDQVDDVDEAARLGRNHEAMTLMSVLHAVTQLAAKQASRI